MLLDILDLWSVCIYLGGVEWKKDTAGFCYCFSFFFSFFLRIYISFSFSERGVSNEQYSQTVVASRAKELRGYDGLTGQASFTALPPYHPDSGGDDGDNDGDDGDETRIVQSPQNYCCA